MKARKASRVRFRQFWRILLAQERLAWAQTLRHEMRFTGYHYDVHEQRNLVRISNLSVRRELPEI